MMNMRDVIDEISRLLESVGKPIDPANGLTIWYNPATGDFVQNKNLGHAVTVIADSQAFGFASQDEPETIFRKRRSLNDLVDAGLARGWVRVFIGHKTVEDPQLQAPNLEAARKTAHWLNANGLVQERVSVEVEQQAFQTFEGGRLAAFLR